MPRSLATIGDAGYFHHQLTRQWQWPGLRRHQTGECTSGSIPEQLFGPTSLHSSLHRHTRTRDQLRNQIQGEPDSALLILEGLRKSFDLWGAEDHRLVSKTVPVSSSRLEEKPALRESVFRVPVKECVSGPSSMQVPVAGSGSPPPKRSPCRCCVCENLGSSPVINWR